MKDIASTIVLVLGMVAPMVAAYLKVIEVLRPLLKRRSLLVGLYAAQESDLEVIRRYAAELRRDGYRHVVVTRAVEALARMQCIVVWLPAASIAADLIRALHQVAPEALVVVYTHDYLKDVSFADRRMLVQSKIRLRNDLAGIAESSSVR